MSTVLDDLDADPILIPHRGRTAWLFPSGRIMPEIRGGEGDDDGEKKFSQADVDRMITSRLKNVKADPPADYEDLKTKAAELDALKAKDKPEVERLTAENAKLAKDLEVANSNVTKVTGDLSTEKRRNAVYVEAAKAGAVNPSQIFALLDADAVTISDDGKVTGADTAVAAFLKDNTHFVPANGGRRMPTPDPAQGSKDDAKVLGDAGRAEAAKRFGTPAMTGAGQK